MGIKLSKDKELISNIKTKPEDNEKGAYDNKIIWLTILFMLIIACVGVNMARANTIEKYENEIIHNTNRVDYLEELKNQLHVTAELLRDNPDVNNGLDATLGEKWVECDVQQKSLKSKNADLSEKIRKLKLKKKTGNIVKAQSINTQQTSQGSGKLIGNFTITHYCPCSTCNGSYGNKTASGTTVTPYRTIAVDPRVIPLGSKVIINGKVYFAEDTGGAIKGNKIDMCVSSHSEAYALGVSRNVPVYIAG